MKKNSNITENWVDIYSEDRAKMGDPVLNIIPLSTREFNQELSAMITRMHERTEWLEIFLSTHDDWQYPVIEVTPLSTEAFNEEIRRMIFNIPDPELNVLIPAIPATMALSKVS